MSDTETMQERIERYERAEAARIPNAAIEVCAQLIERECYDRDEAVRLSALIRALKEKP